MQGLVPNSFDSKRYSLDHPEQWSDFQGSPPHEQAMSDIQVLNRVTGNMDDKPDNRLVLVNDDGNPRALVPVDQDFTFPTDPRAGVFWGREGALPDRYNPSTISRLRELQESPYRIHEELGSLLNERQVTTVIARIDQVLSDVDSKLAIQGPINTYTLTS